MENNKERLSCEQVKRMDMVVYLSGLGHEPARVRNINYWYLSPLRAEKTPSFKVNRRINRWYDHGIGTGGNLVDFGVCYHQCSVAELLQILSGNFSFQQHDPLLIEQAKPDHKMIMEQDKPITSLPLLQYLEDRRITVEIAHRYCREIHYRVGEKTYYAIGFKNNSGGYELRSPYFKSSTAPKDITTINNSHYNVVVFEGFFDFLSYLTYYDSVEKIRRGNGQAEVDYMILNSLAFFERARPFMERHGRILLCLDHDKAGQNCSFCAMSLSDKYEDDSQLYKGYKDFNEWLVNGEERQRNDFMKNWNGK